MSEDYESLKYRYEYLKRVYNETYQCIMKLLTDPDSVKRLALELGRRRALKPGEDEWFSCCPIPDPFMLVRDGPLSPDDTREALKSLHGELGNKGRPVDLRKDREILEYILESPNNTYGKAAKKFGFKDGKACWTRIDNHYKAGLYGGDLLALYLQAKAKCGKGRPTKKKKDR
jgi:hypothetical protein